MKKKNTTVIIVLVSLLIFINSCAVMQKIDNNAKMWLRFYQEVRPLYIDVRQHFIDKKGDFSPELRKKLVVIDEKVRDADAIIQSLLIGVETTRTQVETIKTATDAIKLGVKLLL